MKWTGDEHGTAVIRPSADSGFAWVCPRRTYCDRGHWDWGFQSLPPLPDQPSYYFMELATALKEVSLWLAQAPAVGKIVPGGPLLTVNHAGLRSWPDKEGPPVWQPGPDDSIVCDVANGPDRLAMSIRKVKGGFQFDLDGQQQIDDADRFPRFYRNAATAMREAGLFAQWRLARIPAQVPGPIDIRFSHPVPESISRRINAQATRLSPSRQGPRP